MYTRSFAKVVLLVILSASWLACEDYEDSVDPTFADDGGDEGGRSSTGWLDILKMVGNNGSPTSAFPLGRCEGDCDSDRECAGDLKCFQRGEGGPLPPGCTGTPKGGNDYCYKPTVVTPICNPGRPVEFIGEKQAVTEGSKLTISRSSATRKGDLLLLFLSGTDHDNAIKSSDLEGFQHAGIQCHKAGNDQECSDNVHYNDLSMAVYKKVATSDFGRDYSFTLVAGGNKHWAKLLVFRNAGGLGDWRRLGFNTGNPAHDQTYTSIHRKYTVCPHVNGVNRGVVICATAFDDGCCDDGKITRCSVPSGMSWAGPKNLYHDELGCVFYRGLTGDGSTGDMVIHPTYDGRELKSGQYHKELSLSLVIKPCI